MLRVGISKRNNGFTLLELVVVLFIIALFSTIAIPRLQFFISYGDTDKAARQIQGMVRYLVGLATAHRDTYRLNYDFRDGVCWVTRSANEGDYVEEKEVLLRPVHLPDGVRFYDIVTPRGIIKEGTAYTQFGPTGWIESTMIHLEGRNVISMKLLPLTGEIRVFEGYVREEES
jgi:prepilin-type N-terminal cleavage/methylation domain-containing protein